MKFRAVILGLTGLFFPGLALKFPQAEVHQFLMEKSHAAADSGFHSDKTDK